MDTKARFRGSIVGLAVGDALGHPTEFMGSVAAIRARYGPRGVTDFAPAGRHPAGTFTDDTQMTIAVARALVRAGRQLSGNRPRPAVDTPLEVLMGTLAEEFVAWSRAAENNRAPGGTCLSGCRNLAQGLPWRAAGVAGSKGCGAAMRAAPVGLFFHHDDELLVRVAAAQSALTHRHPTGYTSSIAAAAAVAWACRGEPLGGLLDYTEACVRRFNQKLYEELGGPASDTAARGVSEMVALLDRTRSALASDHDDVCQLLGGAWIGEEAVACALWCVVRADGNFRDSVLRGANSSGDSDSIATIAGSITGAWGGESAIPTKWVDEVERGADLLALADALHTAREETFLPSGAALSKDPPPAVSSADLGPALTFFTVYTTPARRSGGPLFAEVLEQTPAAEDSSASASDDLPDGDAFEEWIAAEDEVTALAAPHEEGEVEEEEEAEEPDEALELRAELADGGAGDPATALANLETLSVEVLAQQIAHHNQRYWDDDKPEISDYDYDRLVRRLRELAPTHPVLDAMGPSMGALGNPVRHREPMLSLDKCYTDDDLEHWLSSFAGDVVAMPKLDGVACTLQYDASGVLRLAATRGDGTTGDDITRNAWASGAIPRRIPSDESLEVRGEIYMRLSVFERFRAEGMANPRNLTAGAIKQKNPERSAAYELSFAAFDARGHQAETLAEVLDHLVDLGFAPLGHLVLPRELAKNGYTTFAARRASLDFEIDGVVFKANSLAEQARLGETSHHPRYAIAYKFQGESGTSILRQVEWSVARTGAITPVAIVDPVPLSGVMVSRASLHHSGFIRKLDLTLGAELLLTRRGGVIPNVEQVVTPGTAPVEIPGRCPACDGEVRLDGDFLYCAVPANCRQAMIGRLAHFAATADMMGFGPALLEQAWDANLLRSPADFYRLTVDQLVTLERCGEKTARKLIAEVDRTRNMPLATFLRALGLPELGRHVSKLLADRYGDLDTILALSESDLANLHSIGDTIARAVVSGLAEARPLIDELRQLVTVGPGRNLIAREAAAAAGQVGLDFAASPNSSADPTAAERTDDTTGGPALLTTGSEPQALGPLAGKSFVFTGTLETYGRKAASAAVEAQGGTVRDSVGGDLSYLVIGTAAGVSSKEKAARAAIAKGAALTILDEPAFSALLQAGASKTLRFTQHGKW